MNDDAIRSLIAGLPGRTGMTRLLRALGFHRPPRAVQGVAVPLRSLATTRRASFSAYAGALRRPFVPTVLQEVARALQSRDPVSHQLIVLSEPRCARVILALSLPGSPVRHAVLEPSAVRAADVELLGELIAAGGEGDTAAALRMLRALDRSRLTARFFRDIVSVRDLVARHWTGVPRSAHEQRNALALLLLSRLMFLYFLQRRGVLDDDLQFLPRLFASWRARPRRQTFYRGQLRTLFFGVLNRQPAGRTARARAMGVLPYLNGGLFELHRIEAEHRTLDIADTVLQRVFADVLEKYRFTSSESTHDAAACGADVDPEMLGRIFEGLMPGDQRQRTGTFYTPSDTVDRVVTDALAEHLARRCDVPVSAVRAALLGDRAFATLPDDVHTTGSGCALQRLRSAAAGLRVLDPACGSGAFLLGALARLGTLRAPDAVERTAVRRDVVAHTLHGVDLLEDAALICSLRLWLALVPERSGPPDIPPLPNLDRRIRQGDALVDPLDLGIAGTGRPLDSTAPPELRQLVASIRPASDLYLRATPAEKPALRRELHRLERALALAWLASLQARLDWNVRELAARAGDTDLFGEPAPHAAAAGRQLAAALRRRDELRAFMSDVGGRSRLPFFSFRVHFAEASAGFDLIVSNPPWVRAHNWPPTVRRLLRERFHVCAHAGWPYANASAGDAAAARATGGAGSQVDLSLLFLEKSLALLNERGTLALLLPAKTLRSLYAGGARDLLLCDAELTRIEDHSLDHRGVFDADAFTSVIIAHRRPGVDDGAAAPPARPPVRVTMRRAGAGCLEFAVDPQDLPLRPGDARAPWLLAPPPCRAVLRAMQQAGPCIGDVLTIRRGVMTGANDVLVVRDVEPKLGDLARIRTEGYHRAAAKQGRAAHTAYVEASALRPALRGADIAAWRATVQRHVIWAPCNDDPRAAAPPRLARFLRRHRGRLDERTPGALQRLSPHTLGHKVAWSDLAADLRAAALPATVRSAVGSTVPLVPFNTVYFIATSCADESMLLSAYLNALPVRVFARAIAERAKDAHFRFFAWTIAVLPLPRDWRSNAAATRLTTLAHAAHARGGLRPHERANLDRLVARCYGLDDAQLHELAAFDAWLAGSTAQTGRHDARAAG